MLKIQKINKWEGTIIWNWRVCNRGLLGIKMIYLEMLHRETRIHYFNVNIILIDGKKWKKFKQRKTFFEGE